MNTNTASKDAKIQAYLERHAQGEDIASIIAEWILEIVPGCGGTFYHDLVTKDEFCSTVANMYYHCEMDLVFDDHYDEINLLAKAR